MTTAHLLELDKSNDLSSYADIQKTQRTQAKKDFEITIEKLVGECEGVCQTVRESAILPEMEDLDPAKLGQRNKKKSMVQQKLEEKDRRHKMQLAEEHKSMLGFYIRLVDYMSIETLVTLILNKTRAFYKSLIDRKKNIFTIKVGYGTRCITFEPNQEEFIEKLGGIFEAMVSDINGMTRLTFRFDEVLGNDRTTNAPQVGEIIKNSDEYRDTCRRIMDKFSEDFVEAQNYFGNSYEKARHVNDYIEKWNFDAYKADPNHGVQQIRDELAQIKE